MKGMLRLTDQDKAMAEGIDRMEQRQRAHGLRVQILDELASNDMTARELFKEIDVDEIHSLRPRLTELKDMGIIRSMGRRMDAKTGINITIWTIKNETKVTAYLKERQRPSD